LIEQKINALDQAVPLAHLIQSYQPSPFTAAGTKSYFGEAAIWFSN
jgi:hypothetical protein